MKKRRRNYTKEFKEEAKRDIFDYIETFLQKRSCSNCQKSVGYLKYNKTNCQNEKFIIRYQNCSKKRYKQAEAVHII